MKKIRKCCVIVLLVVLFPANIFAQERRDKEQTYVLENPYEVNKITPLQGKKIKNVVLATDSTKRRLARVNFSSATRSPLRMR